jgi:phytoene synthase
VREAAHAALPGEIRMQWWSDVISGERAEEARANPVASALLTTIGRHRLPATKLLELIEARRFDLYDDPMASLADLESYVQKTSSALIALAVQILAGEGVDAVAQPAGIAYGVAGLLRAFPVHLARHQLYVPQELLERHEVHLHDLFAGRSPPGLAVALAELRELARHYLVAAREPMSALPEAAIPALLPLALVRPLLNRLPRSRPLTPVELAPWRRQWLIWRAARNPTRIAG